MVQTSKVLLCYVALKETFVLQSDELSHMTEQADVMLILN